MDSSKEEKFVRQATGATVALAFAGVTGGGVGLSYLMLGDELEGAETQFSLEVAQDFNAKFADMVELRDSLKDLERDRVLAYQNHDEDMVKALEDEIEGGVDAFDEARNDLLNKAVTNSFLSEHDYKGLLKDFNAQGISTYIDYAGDLNANEAEYLNACRIDASNNGVPLRASASDAYEVASCMSHKEENFIIGVMLLPFMGAFLTFMGGILSASLRGDYQIAGPVKRGYRKLYRKFNTKLGQN